MGLYEKIYNVMCESTALEKDMKVGGQYSAISEKAVLNEIKPLLKKHKLVLMPIEANVTQQDKLTVISAKYKIVDIETGESEILATIGNGADSQDKGSGKAWTYAYKCLLQKTFCLFSGEDTDNTHSDDIIKAPKPTNLDCNELITIGYIKGYSPEQIDKMLVKKFGHNMGYISKEELATMIDGFKGLADKE
jgi:hypothetical protein